jgi:hypothetical protein
MGLKRRIVSRDNARSFQRVQQNFVGGTEFRNVNAAAPQGISDRAIGYREAGYTIACWSLGFRVKRAAITSQNKPSEFLTWLRAARFSHNSGLLRRSIVRYHDRIVCALAGLEAQRRAAPKAIGSSQAHSDQAIAANLLLRLHGEERERTCALTYLKARARNLVNRHWQMIQDLAKALLERPSMTGKEVGDVLRANLQAEANTMTHLESLRRQLQYSVEKYGESDPVTLGIKRQIDEIEQSKLSGQSRCAISGGLPKAKGLKRPKA